MSFTKKLPTLLLGASLTISVAALVPSAFAQAGAAGAGSGSSAGSSEMSGQECPRGLPAAWELPPSIRMLRPQIQRIQIRLDKTWGRRRILPHPQVVLWAQIAWEPARTTWAAERTQDQWPALA